MLWAFPLPQISAPVPADLNLPGSKKAPGRVPSFGWYHRLPQDSPSRIRAAERHSATILYSLVSPRPSPPTSRERQRAALSRGRRISSPAAMRDCKTPFPPHVPACRAQAHSEPGAAERHTATIHSSLFPLPSPHSGLPVPLPGKAREPPSAGVDICSFICNNCYTT